MNQQQSEAPAGSIVVLFRLISLFENGWHWFPIGSHQVPVPSLFPIGHGLEAFCKSQKPDVSFQANLSGRKHAWFIHHALHATRGCRLLWSPQLNQSATGALGVFDSLLHGEIQTAKGARVVLGFESPGFFDFHNMLVSLWKCGCTDSQELEEIVIVHPPGAEAPRNSS